ncbi:MAG TPA: DUF3551 domain-containing protein [Xanthobacteraceae bacterium]|nr:DUF3551 domain-containing protein [Xanthobacteraceae bacterium]
MPKPASVLAIAVAALAVASVVQVRSGHAQYYGDAPWCAVLQIGTGSVVWHCYYRTAEECAPQVVAGNRGTCNLNPYGPAAQPKRLKRYPG